MAKGLAVGLNKGHEVNKIEKSSKIKKKTSKRNANVRAIVRELCGHSPFERKIMELLKQSRANTQKKAYKIAKKSLGTHRRALKKRNELQEAVHRHEH